MNCPVMNHIILSMTLKKKGKERAYLILFTCSQASQVVLCLTSLIHYIGKTEMALAIETQ